MSAKEWVNIACLVGTAICVSASAYFLYQQHYLYALLSLGENIVFVETRVRLGYRGPRKSVFKIHLACSMMYLLSLVLLLLTNLDAILLSIAWLAFAGMLSTGLLLIRQSWNRMRYYR